MGTKVHTIHKDAVTGYMPGDCMLAVLCECANGNNNGFETGADGLHTISERLHYGNEFDINGDGSNTGFTYVSASCSSGYLFLADVSSARATRNPGNTFLVSGRKYCLQYQRTGSANNFVFDDDGAGMTEIMLKGIYQTQPDVISIGNPHILNNVVSGVIPDGKFSDDVENFLKKVVESEEE